MKGEWIERYGLYLCSQCGQIIGEYKKNYCPTCGADMRGKKMTNAEKYKEVFGFSPDTGNCPTEDCNQCPCKQIDNNGNLTCIGISVSEWWNEEYKGNDTVKVEVIEQHTFAKPDDVSDIDFPSSGSEDK